MSIGNIPPRNRSIAVIHPRMSSIFCARQRATPRGIALDSQQRNPTERRPPAARSWALGALLLTACGTDDPAQNDPPAQNQTTTGGTTSVGGDGGAATTLTSGTSTTSDDSAPSTATTATSASSMTAASASSGTGGTAATVAMVDDSYVDGLTLSVHDDVKTILVATWEQLIEADDTWLEFSFEGSEVMHSRPSPGTLGDHRDVVLGVPGETEVSVSVVSQVGGALYKSSSVVGTTDAVPASMPTPIVMDYDPDRASPDRWLLGAVEDSGDNVANNLQSYLSYQAWLYIIDRQGRIVWYYNDPSRNSPSGFPRQARDGEYLVAEESRVGNQGRVIKMTLDRQYFEVIDLPGLADAIDVTEDGSLLFDVGNSGELHELTKDGADRTLWDCRTELDLNPNCYSNTINYNPSRNSIFMSFPEPGAIVEIDRASGEMVAYFGNQPGAWAFAPPLETPPDEWRFGFQHFPNLTPEGNLIVSSHMPGFEAFTQTPTPNQHAFIEFSIDRDAQILTEVWRYTEGPEWPRSRGMALRLSNGNTLVNYGTGGVIREVTPDKQTVFYVKFDIDGGDDAYNKLVGNNFFINDLYSLNGGPP